MYLRFGLHAFALSAVTSLACTFVTDCPKTNGGNTQNSGGSGSASGGQANGGNSHRGGASNSDAGAPESGGSPEGGNDNAAGQSNDESGGKASNKGGASGNGGSTASGSWVNVTSNLANMDSECGNMSSVSAKPDEDLLIAGVAQKGLWGSRDGGKTWKQMGQGSGSDTITNRTTAIIYDPDDTNHFWESGIYNGGGVYETFDDGDTFKQLGSVNHTDYVSIDLGDPDRKTLLAGGHEQARTLNLSTDGGQNWTAIGSGLPDGTNCTQPLVIDSKTFLVGCGGYGGGPTGIYCSTDSGKTWKSLTTSGGATQPLVGKDGSIYWGSANGGPLARSDDNGVSFQDMGGAGMISGGLLVQLPDGSIASLGSGGVMASSDQGKTWNKIIPDLPYNDVSGLAYSPARKAFYVWHFTCGFDGPVPIPSDAIMRHDFE